jgi:hypothetical protein
MLSRERTTIDATVTWKALGSFWVATTIASVLDNTINVSQVCNNHNRKHCEPGVIPTGLRTPPFVSL